MNSDKFIAKVEIEIQSPAEKVWDALVNTDKIKEYMFGTTVTSDWKVGSSITWSGEWEGKPYKDHGKVLAIESPHHLQYSHVSGSDAAGDQHNVDIHLNAKGNQTYLSLTQDNNKNEEMKSASEKNWAMMLNLMKEMLEV